MIVSEPGHVYAAVASVGSRSPPKLEIMNTVFQDETGDLRSSLNTIFRIKRDWDVEQLFPAGYESFSLQHYESPDDEEEGSESKRPDILQITGGMGQCAYWVYRMLYRRLVIGCSLREMRQYFTVAEPLEVITSLEAFVLQFTTAAHAFSIAIGGGATAQKALKLAALPEGKYFDVPCYVHKRHTVYKHGESEAESDSDSGGSAAGSESEDFESVLGSEWDSESESESESDEPRRPQKRVRV
jgi:hypothetical protein